MSTATSVATGRALLWGVVAGPLFVVVGLAQAFTRKGFDFKDHTLSLLTNGDIGWIQIVNFIVSGLLFAVSARAMGAAMAPGQGRTWGPRLVAAFGIGTAAAGLFVPDPAYGFPPGTPPGQPDNVSWHGALHFIVASLALLALVGACFVFARRFRTLGRPEWGAGSGLVGVLLIVGLGAVSQSAVGNIAFTVAALVGFLWVSALAMRLRSDAM